jgi:hypothetical protein
MKRILSVFLAVVFLTAIFAIPAFARASTHLSFYSVANIPRGSGNIEVTVNVIGTHSNMTTIGFPTIVLYERISGGSWRGVESHTNKYNPNSTAGSHSFAFTYKGVAGRQYYVSASFYAQDTAGFDTRSAISTAVTAT